jgi:hypothetical protein
MGDFRVTSITNVVSPSLAFVLSLPEEPYVTDMSYAAPTVTLCLATA